MMIWPDSVAVLTGRNTLVHKPGCDHHNVPHSPELTAQDEFRDSKYFHKLSTHATHMMISIWEYRYHCLLDLHAKYLSTYSIVDVYNAAWASCGYTQDQSNKAMELAGKRFAWNLDDYKPEITFFPLPETKRKSKKKVNPKSRKQVTSTPKVIKKKPHSEPTKVRVKRKKVIKKVIKKKTKPTTFKRRLK
jgi:hypothetical protein